MAFSKARQVIKKWFSLIGTRFNRFRKLARPRRTKLSLLQLEHRVTPTASVIHSWSFLYGTREAASVSTTLFAPNQVTASGAFTLPEIQTNASGWATPTAFRLEGGEAPSTVLQAGILIAQARIHRVAASANYASLMTDVFGRTTTDTRAFGMQLGLLQQTLVSGGLGVRVEVLDNQQMPMARAAYTPFGPDGKETIYLNRAYLTESNSPDQVADLLTEEFGHALDQRLNGGMDSPGDEGEWFSRLASGGQPNAGEMLRLASEDDHDTLRIAGKTLAIEKATAYFAEVFLVPETGLDANTATTGPAPMPGSNFAFTSLNPSDPLFTATGGNNVQGTFSYIDLTSGLVVTVPGTISRKEKQGGQVIAMYMASDAPGTQSYFLVLNEAAINPNTKYSTSSDLVVEALNGILAGAPTQGVVITSVVDDFGGVTGPVPSGGFTDDTTPTVQGTISSVLLAGQSLAIFRNGVTLTNITFAGTSWSYTDSGLVVGSKYTYTAYVEDNATSYLSPPSNNYSINLGNPAPTQTVTISSIYDNVPSDVGPVPNGGFTNDLTPSLSGTLSSVLLGDQTLYVYRNGNPTPVGAAIVSGTTWTFTDASLADGTYTYTARVVDSAAQQGSLSSPYVITVDTAPPAAPIVTNVTELAGDPNPDDLITNDATQILTVSGQAGCTIGVYTSGGVPVASSLYTVSETAGTYTVNFGGNILADGSYCVTLTDAAANESAASIQFTIDTTAPAQIVLITAVTDNLAPYTGLLANGATTNDTAPDLAGTLSVALGGGEVVAIYRNGLRLGTALISGTTWSYADTGLVNGTTYNYIARVEDAAGNQGPSSNTFTLSIDTLPPAQSVTITSVTDNVAPYEGTVPNGGVTNDTTPVLAGTVTAPLAPNESLVIYRNDVQVGVASVSDTTWTFADTGLINGSSYNYTARVVDAASQVGPLSPLYRITIDTSSPTQTVVITTITDSVSPYTGTIPNDGVTNDSSPDLGGTLSAALGDGESVVLYRNGARIGTALVTGTNWTYADTGLTDGMTYHYTARVEDAASNPGASSNTYSILLDLSLPTQLVTIVSVSDNAPPQTGSVASGGITNDTTPTLSGTLSAPLELGEQVILYRGGAPVGAASISGTTWSFTDGGLAHGATYNYTARVVDAASNPGALSNTYSITIDTEAPTQVPMITAVLDDVSPQTGTVADGGFTNDTAPGVAGTLSASLNFGETVIVYRNGIRLGGATTIGTNWTYADSGLIHGVTYTYTARVEDAASNVGVESAPYSITIDTSVPGQVVSILSVTDDIPPATGVVASGGVTNDTAPLLSGSLSAALGSGESVIVYRNGLRLGAALPSGTTWIFADSGLVNGGTYSYTARVEDLASNAGSDSSPYTITIDTVSPPQTVTIVSITDDVSPATGVIPAGGVTNDMGPALAGTLSASLAPGETLYLYRNGVKLGAASTVGTSWTFADSGLTNGSTYSYTARVEDLASNAGDFSAAYAISVDTSVPGQTVTITSLTDDVDPWTGNVPSGGTTNDTAPVLGGTLSAGLATGEVVAVYRDGIRMGTALVTGTTWSYADSGLANGSTHSYSARVEDLASNAGNFSLPYVVSIDTVSPTQTVVITGVVDDVDPFTGTVANGGTTNDTSPLVTGSLSAGLNPGESVVLYRNGMPMGTAVTSGTIWTYADSGLANGSSYSYTARVEDLALNAGAFSAPYAIAIDTGLPTQTVTITSLADDVTPATGNIPSGGTTNDTAPVLGGTLSVGLGTGESVAVYRDGARLGTATVSGTTWTFADSGLMTGTTYSYTARVEDLASNQGPLSAPYVVTLDTVSPDQLVTITAVTDDVDPFTGTILSGGVTNDTAPVLSGTLSGSLQAGETVYVYRGGVKIGSATTVGTTWTYADSGLVHGATYSYTGRVEDLAANAGAFSAPYSITIDTSAPTQVVSITSITDDIAPVTGTVPNGGTTNDQAPLVAGSLSAALGAGETVYLYRNGVKLGAAITSGLSWTYADTGLVNGLSYTYTARVEDLASNASGYSTPYTITIDTGAPNQTVVITLLTDDVAPATGNVPSGGTTNDVTPLLGGTVSSGLGSDEAVAIYRDGVRVGNATTVGTSWTFADSGLVHGNTYTYTARVEDLASNAGPFSTPYSVSVDTLVPGQVVAITSLNDDVAPFLGNVPSGGVTNDTTPLLGGTLSAVLSAGESVVIYRDGVARGTATTVGTSWSFADSGLVNGSTYGYTARVEDLALNVGAFSNTYLVSVDTSSPGQTVTITTIADDVAPFVGNIPSGGVTNDTAPVLGGTLSAVLAAGESVVVYRDGVKLGDATVSGTTWNYADSGLADGSTHSYTARVEDLALNASAFSNPYTVTIDTSSPAQVVAITSVLDDEGPFVGNIPSGGTTNDTAPVVGGTLSAVLTAGESVFIYRDGVKLGAATTSGTTWSYADSGLANGTTYSYTARVEDLALNFSAFSAPYTITVDTNTPAQSVLITSLNDDVAPVTGNIPSGGVTNDTAPVLGGTLSSGLSVGEAVYVYRDGVKLGAAITASHTWTFADSGLTGGSTYSYTARVEDLASNASPFSPPYTVTVDTSLPGQTVTITAINDNVAPYTGTVPDGGITNDTTPTLLGSLSAALLAGEAVYVYRDGIKLGAAATTGTAWSYTDSGLVHRTSYFYTARVEDLSSNAGPFSLPYGITIDTSSPTQTVVISSLTDDVAPYTGNVPSGGVTNDTAPVVGGNLSSALNPDESVHVYRDGILVGVAITTGTTWSYADSGLLNGGSYSYAARVEDLAANAGPFSAPYTVSVDTDAPTQSVTITSLTDNVDPFLGNIPSGGVTNDTTPLVGGTISAVLAPGEAVFVYRDGVKLGSASTTGTNWSFADSGLVGGNTYSYTARVEDLASNSSAFSAPYSVSVDTTNPGQLVAITGLADDVAPFVGNIPSGGTTNDTAPVLSGTLSASLAAGEAVVIYRDGIRLGAAASAGLTWTFADSGLVDGGPYSYTARVEDAALNAGPFSASYSVTVDTALPLQSVAITSLADDVAPFLGNIPSGGTTNDTAPVLGGTLSVLLAPGESVVVYRDGIRLGAATVTGTTWIYADSGLAGGATYSYTARVEDLASNTGGFSPAYGVTVETSAPTQTVFINALVDDVAPYTGTLPSGGTSNDTAPVLNGSVSTPLLAGEMVYVYRDGVNMGAATVSGLTWSFPDSGLADGITYSYTARVEDLASNTSGFSAPYSVTIDTTAPAQVVAITGLFDDVTPFIGNVPSGGTTNDTTPLLAGSLSLPLAAGESVVVYRNGIRLGAASTTGTTWTFLGNGMIDGASYTYEARVEDLASNVGAFSNPYTIHIDIAVPGQTVVITSVLDDVAPYTGLVANGGVTNDTAPVIAGTLSAPLAPGDTVYLYRNGVKLGAAITSGTNWSYADSGLADGASYLYESRVEDLAANASNFSGPYTITVDTSIPSQVVSITSMTDNVAPFTGNIPSGGTTNDTTPELGGTLSAPLAAGESVVVYRDGVRLGAASGSGLSWTFAANGLVNGNTYTYNARVEDLASNAGAFSNAYSISVDTANPTQTVVITTVSDDVSPAIGTIPSGGTTNDTAPLVGGLLSSALNPGESVILYRNGLRLGAALATGTTWSYADSGLADGGTYLYEARVEDLAANAGIFSGGNTIHVDTSSPGQLVAITAVFDDVAPFIGNVPDGGTTNDVAPEVSGTLSGPLASGEAVVVYRDGVRLGTAVTVGSSWSYTGNGMVHGHTYVYTARVEDLALNAGTFSGPYTIRIDTSAPVQTVLVTAVVDDVAPFTGTVPSSGTTNDTAPVVSGTLSGSLNPGETVYLYRNGLRLGAATTVGTAWSFADSGLVDGGSYSYTARVEDLADNVGPNSPAYSVTVDTSTPAQAVIITSVTDDVAPFLGTVPSGGTTNDITPLVGGTLSSGLLAGESVYVYRDGIRVGSATVSSLSWSFADSGLIHGNTYTYTARVEDLAANVGAFSAPYTITLDIVAPAQTVSITSITDDVAPITGTVANGGTSNDTAPVIAGTLSVGLQLGETLRIYRDGVLAGAGVVSGTAWTFADSGLASGSTYTYTARVEDLAFNVSPFSAPYSITIDTSSPTQSVFINAAIDDVAPQVGLIPDGGVTNDIVPTLSGSISAVLQDGESVVLYRDGVKLGAASTTNVDWTHTGNGLVDGVTYTYTARVEDLAGNVGPFSAPYVIRVDLTAPNAPVLTSFTNDTGTPGDGVTADNNLTLTGTAEPDATVLVYDGGTLLGTVTADGAGLWTLSGTGLLADGNHFFAATATDAAGNVSARSSILPVHVDTTAPDSPVITTFGADTGLPGDALTADNNLFLSGLAESHASVRVYDGATLLGTVLANGTGTWVLPTTGILPDGAHAFRADATDAAGNLSALSAPLVVTIDTTAPVTPVILSFSEDTGVPGDSITADNSLLLTGFSEIGSTITVYDNGVFVNSFVETGSYTYLTPLLSDGLHAFTVTSTDAAGNVSALSNVMSVTIDTRAPDAPAITGYSIDSGNVGDGITNDNNLDITGIAEPNSTVRVYDGGNLLGFAPVNSAGIWTLAGTGSLADGSHHFVATATDAAGNTSNPSADLNVRVDTAAPGVPAITAFSVDSGILGDNRTNDNNLTLSGNAEPDSLVRIFDGASFVGSVFANSKGAWVLPATGILADGQHIFTAEALDVAGNLSGTSAPFQVTIDTTAPITPLFLTFSDDTGTPGDGVTADNTLLMTGLAEVGTTIRIYDNGALIASFVETGSYTYTTPVLADGLHIFTATSTDAAGNVSPVSNPFPVTIDTQAPPVPVITGYSIDSGVAGDGITNDNNLVISGTGTSGTLVRVYNEGTFIGSVVVNGSGTWTLVGTGTLSEGTHYFTATAADAAGNVSAQSDNLAVTVDTIAPAGPTINAFLVDSGTPGDSVTNDKDLILTGNSEPHSIVRVFNGAALIGTVAANGTGTWTLASTGILGEGLQVFTADATDVAGNTSVASAALGVVIDSVPPDAPMVLSFASDTGLPGDSLTRDTDLSLSGTAEPLAVVRVYEGITLLGTVTADSTGLWALPGTGPLGDRLHLFQATATDAAGNTSTLSSPLAVTIDSQAPGAPVITGFTTDSGVPGDGITNDNSLVLTGAAEPGATVSLYNESSWIGSVTANGSGLWTLPGTGTLADGKHYFQAIATDRAGNDSGSSAVLEILVDTLAPSIPAITTYANDTGNLGDGITGDNILSLSGNAEPGSTVQVFDGAVLLGTTTANSLGGWSLVSTGPLADGIHLFTAEALDPAGNRSGTSSPLPVTIDTRAPDAPVFFTFSEDTGVVGDRVTSDNTLTMTGFAEIGSMIHIYDNGILLGSFVETGAYTYLTPTLADGLHVFTATATDVAGNVSLLSQPFPVTIDTLPPEIPVITGFLVDTHVNGDGITSDNNLAITGTGTGQIEIYDGTRLVGTVASGGVWTLPSTGVLADGEYLFTARALDAAGNASALSPGFRVLIDTVAPGKPEILGYSEDTGTQGDSVTRDTNLALFGTSDPGTLVRVIDGGIVLGFAQADLNGNWVLPETGTLIEGKHIFTAIAMDQGGNNSGTSGILALTIDTTPPSDPVVTAFSFDSGVPGDFVTNDTDLALTGTADPGIDLEIFDGKISLGGIQADDQGRWTLVSTGPLSHGLHLFNAVATDTAGNQSNPSRNLVVFVDLQPPQAPIVTRIDDDTAIPTDRITADNTLTATGFSGGGALVRMYANGVLVGEAQVDPVTGNYSTTSSQLQDGKYSIEVRNVDAAGNEGTGASGGDWVVDTTAPVAPLITGFSEDTGTTGDWITTDRDLELFGTGEPETRVIIRVDGNPLGSALVDALGKWSLPATGDLSLGDRLFTAFAEDVAGNRSAESPAREITIASGFEAPSPQAARFIIDIQSEVHLDTGNGIAPMTFEVVSGDLPPGLSLDGATGIISGRATVLGKTSITVRMTDMTGSQSNVVVNLRVDPANKAMLVASGLGNKNNLNSLSPSMVNPLSYLNGTAVTLWGTAAPDPGSIPHAVGQIVPYVGYTGQVNVYLEELNKDGRPVAITGTGRGASPHVMVIDVQSGEVLHSFYAFDPAFKGGVNVSAGDFNNDGVNDIVVVSGQGARTHIKVFDSRDLAVVASFYPFDASANSNGGASATIGDADGDGDQDLIVGAAPGSSPYVSVFDTASLSMVRQFLAFDAGYLGGINVSSGDLKGDGVEEIAVGSNISEAHVTVWSAKSGELINSFYAYGQNDGMGPFPGGVRVGLVAYAQEAVDVLVTGAGAGSLPHARVWSFSVPTYVESFYVAPITDLNGVNVG